jgi:RNA polymerase sigma factor (sigma-70 family)
MYTAKGKLDVNSMLKQYSPLVRRLAHQMLAKLPANVELDDLVQVGMIGLTDALSRFDTAQGVQFETFATQRIRGAMLDELRGTDYLSRGTRKQQRAIESAVHRLEQRLGRAPVESEIARCRWPNTRNCSVGCAAPSSSTSKTCRARAATRTSSTATPATKPSTRSPSCRTRACARR